MIYLNHIIDLVIDDFIKIIKEYMKKIKDYLYIINNNNNDNDNDKFDNLIFIKIKIEEIMSIIFKL